MNNYTIISNGLITSTLSDGGFRLLGYLTSICFGDKTECWPSQKYIAEKLNKSVRTIQRNIKELIKAGYIKKRRRGSISNMYTILTKLISEKIKKVVDKVKTKNSYNNYKKNKIDHFNNFPHRKYDYGELESKLLGWTKVPDRDGSLYDQRSF